MSISMSGGLGIRRNGSQAGVKPHRKWAADKLEQNVREEVFPVAKSLIT
jgi:hypothetical protein